MKKPTKAEELAMYQARTDYICRTYMEDMTAVVTKAALPTYRVHSSDAITFYQSQKISDSKEILKERWITYDSGKGPYKNSVSYIWHIIPLYIGSRLTDIKAESADYTYLFRMMKETWLSEGQQSDGAIVERVIRFNAAGKNAKTLYSSGKDEDWHPFPTAILKQLNELMYDYFFDGLWEGTLRGGWYWSRNQVIRTCCGEMGVGEITLTDVLLHRDTRHETSLKTLTRSRFENGLSQQGTPLYICANMEATRHIADISPLMIRLDQCTEMLDDLSPISQLYPQMIYQAELYAEILMETHQSALQGYCLETLTHLCDELEQQKDGYWIPKKIMAAQRISASFQSELYRDTMDFWTLPVLAPSDGASLPQAFASIQRLQKCCMDDINQYFKDRLKCYAKRRKQYEADMDEYYYGDYSSQLHKVDAIEDYVEAVFDMKRAQIETLARRYKKALVKEYARVSYDLLNLKPLMKQAQDFLEETAIPADKKSQALYLTTSFMAIGKRCGLPSKCTSQLIKVLESNWQVYKRPSARAELESYLLQCIKNGACARIRGRGSKGPAVRMWYHPDGDKEWFLLPYKTYWNECSAYVYPGTEKKAWETSLGDILVIKENGNQKRRSFITRVHDTSKEISVLRIKTSRLSDEFMKQAAVQTFIRDCEVDTSPWRTDTKPNAVLPISSPMISRYRASGRRAGEKYSYRNTA